MRRLRGRDFLTVQDFSREELMLILETTKELKLAHERGEEKPLLKNKSLGMIFEEPSTRTRVSFEVGIQQLGGIVLYLKPGEIHLGVRETIADTARVLSRFLDGIVARLHKHATLLELARHASVPVINGMTDLYHPLQAICDIYTIWEKFGTFDVNVAFVGDATNVCNSLILACTKMGINLTVANPKKYSPKEHIQELAKENAKISGGTIRFIESPAEAVKDADIVYTDLWWWIGQEAEIEERKKVFPPYQVNEELLRKAKPDVKFMHCLPAARGMEVTDSVIDGPHSIVFDQAENRMHTEKAIVSLLI